MLDPLVQFKLGESRHGVKNMEFHKLPLSPKIKEVFMRLRVSPAYLAVRSSHQHRIAGADETLQGYVPASSGGMARGSYNMRLVCMS